MMDSEALVTAYAELYLQLMRTADRMMAEQGASFARTKLLLCLQKRGPLRGTDIAEFFSQSPRTVTEAIDGLERDGLVERVPDPSDRRAKRIHITPKGIEAAARTEPLRRQLIDQTFGTLDAAEREALAAILDKLSSALHPDKITA
jgi:DNA-binding MarR family transcriptional regulator